MRLLLWTWWLDVVYLFVLWIVVILLKWLAIADICHRYIFCKNCICLLKVDRCLFIRSGSWIGWHISGLICKKCSLLKIKLFKVWAIETRWWLNLLLFLWIYILRKLYVATIYIKSNPFYTYTPCRCLCIRGFNHLASEEPLLFEYIDWSFSVIARCHFNNIVHAYFIHCVIAGLICRWTRMRQLCKQK